MIGTIETYPQAHSPDFPLDTLKAFVGSPSSMRIRNVPKKVGSWQITKVYVEVVYPDNTSQTADCTLVGGVWVCTIAGSSTAGTLTQGYTVYADGTDENGNAVTGYILGKGDVVIMQASSTPEPEPATIFVRLKDDGTDAEEGAIFPTEDGYAVQQNGETHLLGRPFDQITAYVDTQVSSKAEISEVEAVAEDVEDLSNSLSNYYTKSETSSAAEINSSFEAVQAAITEVDNSLSDYYLKNETSSSVEIQNTLDTKQPVGDYALTSQIPTAVSQLENDAGYLTEHQSLSDYYTKSQTSSNVELDTQFATKADLTAIPTKVSQLSNDSGFITSADHITDDVGNSISANLSVHYQTDSFNWYVDGVKGSPDNSFWSASYTPTDTQYNGWELNIFEGSSMPDAYDFAVNWTSYIDGQWIPDSTMMQGLLPVGQTEFTNGEHTARVAYKYEDGKLAKLDDIPTKVSQLSNDAGYLTEHQSLSDYYTKSETSSNVELDTMFETKADLSALSTKADLSALDDYYTKNETSSAVEISNALETKRDWNDMTVKGIPPNAQQSRFNISDGTTTNNAYWYDEGRWESGQSFAVYATLTADVYELKKYDTATQTSVGTFSLDSNYEATITNDGTTYSIIGYAGDLVVNTQLTSYATQEWVMQQLAALSVMLQGGN